MSLNHAQVITALQAHAPSLLRWAGAIAVRLRRFNIKLEGKSSGSALTDALTLADITVQELLIAGLRDADPVLRQCRIEAEEANGDFGAFNAAADLTIALDPIDGTKQFSDLSGDGYCVMLHARTAETVIYSLVFCPEMGPTGTWVEAYGQTIKCGADDTALPARVVLDGLPLITACSRLQAARSIYLIGFQQDDAARADLVTQAGLVGVAPEQMPGSIYPLLARGEFAGSLIHSPNIYDFPVSLHLARLLGGEAVWVDSGRPVHFRETWLDDRAGMLRLPGIVACAVDPDTLNTLCNLAKDWNPVRYVD